VQGARCEVRRASALPRGAASAVIGPWTAVQLDMQISTCRCGFMFRWDADLALGKFCPVGIGRGGGNLRSSDVRAECKIDVGHVREMLLRLSFPRYDCASFHHHYQWRALN